MTKCEGCGASVDSGLNECPYCGHSIVKHVPNLSTIESPSDVYRRDQESGTVHFGNGISGARPVSGKDNVSASYRDGGGKRGNLPCLNCGHTNPSSRITCEACGSELQRRIIHRRREIS